MCTIVVVDMVGIAVIVAASAALVEHGTVYIRTCVFYSRQTENMR